MTHVVVLRALGLGDLLTAVPALRALRRHDPHARITLASPPAVGRWLAAQGVVDDVVPAWGTMDFAWREQTPDLAVNLHGSGPQSHRALQRLRPRQLLAFASREAAHDDGPPWSAAEHEVDRWVRLAHWAGMPCSADDLRLSPPDGTGRLGLGHVVVHPGAASASRRWPAQRWAAVARNLTGNGCRVVVTGGPDEHALCAEVAREGRAENRCGRDDLASLAALVAAADLLLCGDTGPAHLATAYGTPSVLLFGPVDPARWGPRIDADIHRVIWHPRTGDPPGDPHGDDLDARLARVTVAEVVAAAEALQPAAC